MSARETKGGGGGNNRQSIVGVGWVCICTDGGMYGAAFDTVCGRTKERSGGLVEIFIFVAFSIGFPRHISS